jgi:hypothetical protein
MPSSYADYVHDWDSLILAVQENAGLLRGFEDYVSELEQASTQAKTVKTRQELHAGGRQKATQDLGAAVTRGKEAAVKLRGFVLAHLGPKNELLVRFGIVPVRKRVRRPAEKPTEPPAE